MIGFTLWCALLALIVVAAIQVAGSLLALPFCLAVIVVGALAWRIAP